MSHRASSSQSSYNHSTNPCLTHPNPSRSSQCLHSPPPSASSSARPNNPPTPHSPLRRLGTTRSITGLWLRLSPRSLAPQTLFNLPIGLRRNRNRKLLHQWLRLLPLVSLLNFRRPRLALLAMRCVLFLILLVYYTITYSVPSFRSLLLLSTLMRTVSLLSIHPALLLSLCDALQSAASPT